MDERKKIYKRLWYEKNKDEIQAKNRLYYLKNKHLWKKKKVKNNNV